MQPVTKRQRSGTTLSVPICEHLEESAEEAAAQRIWRGIERHLQRGQRSPPAARSWLRLAAALALASVVALPFAAPGTVRGLSNRAVELWYGPRPLERASGGAFEGLRADSTGRARADLSDGSSIEVEAGAHVDVLASTETQLALVVREGRARFSVIPGGPRRWSIEARGVTVEVVGTMLSVESHPRGVEVRVEVGSVIVRSAKIADGVQRLRAGEALFVATEPDAGGRPAEETPVSATGVAAGAPPGPPPGPPPAGARAAARARAESVRDLWSRADAARRAGDARSASELLEQITAQHPKDARAPLAAFTLGTLLAHELRQPARAAAAFRRALDLGLPQVLHDRGYVELARAWANAGNAAAVGEVVREYAAAHPGGEALGTLRALAGEAR